MRCSRISAPRGSQCSRTYALCRSWWILWKAFAASYSAVTRPICDPCSLDAHAFWTKIASSLRRPLR
eukprot:1566236-Pyramimonas_sp.AAC.1